MIINLKKNLLVLTLLSCAAAGTIGCSKTASNAEPAKGNSGVEKTATNEKTDKNPTSPTNRDTPEIAAAGDKIGVAECDDYIEKYEACLTKNVPEQSRAMMKASFEQTRKTWKDIAANPQTKASLSSVCKQSKEAVKQATSAYHCEW